MTTRILCKPSAVSILILLVSAGCNSQNGTNTDADIAAINAVVEQVTEAYIARDWDRFSALFTEDAIWMPDEILPLPEKMRGGRLLSRSGQALRLWRWI